MADTLKAKHRSRQRKPEDDYPYTMKLPDGRSMYVEVPGRWVTTDRGGEAAFLPQAVRFLDRVWALATPLHATRTNPSPGFIAILRKALGLTQQELGERIGVDKMTVSRWERGTVRPSAEPLAHLEKVRKHAVHKGVPIST